MSAIYPNHTDEGFYWTLQKAFRLQGEAVKIQFISYLCFNFKVKKHLLMHTCNRKVWIHSVRSSGVLNCHQSLYKAKVPLIKLIHKHTAVELCRIRSAGNTLTSTHNRHMESNSCLTVIQTVFNHSWDSHRSPVGLHYYTYPWSALIMLQHHMDREDYILWKIGRYVKDLS